MARRGKGGTSDRAPLLGSELTVDGGCSQEARCVLLGGKTVTNLDSVLKSRDIALLVEVGRVKAMVSPVVTYSGESWTVKKQNAKELMPWNCGA